MSGIGKLPAWPPAEGQQWFTMENPFVQKRNMTLARGAFRQQQFQAQTTALVEWFHVALPHRPVIPNTEQALIEGIKDGNLLCELMHKIAPETGIKVAGSTKSEFHRLENVAAFIKAAQEIGVRSLFDAGDLFEGRLAKILPCLLSLNDVAKKRGFWPLIGDKPKPVVTAPTPAPVPEPEPLPAPASVAVAVAVAEAEIAEAELEVPEAEIDETNLEEFERAEEELEAAREAERLRQEEEEARRVASEQEAARLAEQKRFEAEEADRKLREELENLRLQNEVVAAENAKKQQVNKTRAAEPSKLPFGNTPATQGEKDCFMARYMEDGPPGRLTIIVVSIDGISVLEPFSEDVIFSALWRRIKSWGINFTGDMFKLDYLPLRYTGDDTVAAWFSCQNGSVLLDAIMKWIAKKKEQLQEEQMAEQGGGAGPRTNSTSAAQRAAERKTSLLKRIKGKGGK